MRYRKISHYIKPSFWVFLLIAALLWYGDKLGDRYTTEVVLPVEVQNDFSSRLWIEDPLGDVTCRAEGVGSKLMAYKMRMGERITIPMSQLTLIPVRGSKQTFRVDKNSLTGALAGSVKDLRIHEILDTAFTINVSPVELRRMALRSRIEVETARQYMSVGGVRLDPDSVDVRGPRAVLDTMEAVFTRPRHYAEVKTTVSGRIDLEQPDGILLSTKQAAYRAEVVPFTQHTLELPVRVENIPSGMMATIVPSRVRVVVNVPLRDYERIREERLHAYVDYTSVRKEQSGKCAVRIDSLPAGTQVVRVEPQFVEPFFTRR
ncbi:MAG: hypothetical protein K2G93_06735 [Rikenella sp.]|nr:hypothetical protein [Rikenella sp.]